MNLRAYSIFFVIMIQWSILLCAMQEVEQACDNQVSKVRKLQCLCLERVEKEVNDYTTSVNNNVTLNNASEVQKELESIHLKLSEERLKVPYSYSGKFMAWNGYIVRTRKNLWDQARKNCNTYKEFLQYENSSNKQLKQYFAENSVMLTEMKANLWHTTTMGKMKRSFYGLRRGIFPTIYFGTGVYLGFGSTSLMLSAVSVGLHYTTLPKAYFASCFFFPFACMFVNELSVGLLSSYYPQYSLPRNICIKFLRRMVNIHYADTISELYKNIHNIDPKAGGDERVRMYGVSAPEVTFLYPYCRFVGFQVGTLAAIYAGTKIYSFLKRT
jgi:hypothetical protein